jgi:uncharacterized membrane protein YkvA (DUF1232 family)
MLLRRAGMALEQPGALATSMEAVRADLATSVLLVKAWVAGEYRGIATSSLVLIVAAILYFVAPLDAVPDIIPIGGFLDDAALIALVASQVKSELNAFRFWQRGSDTHSPG